MKHLMIFGFNDLNVFHFLIFDFGCNDFLIFWFGARLCEIAFNSMSKTHGFFNVYLMEVRDCAR